MLDEIYWKIEGVFRRALSLPPDARSEFLDEACAGDGALRAGVERLLSADTTGGGFLEPPDAASPGQSSSAALATGQMIGGFEVVDLIGAGGMGAVYRAVQVQPRRTVALKVLRPGIASGALLRRFRHEAEVLARLRHPGIAHVYEAGVHVEGASVPYFAMEYVPDAKTLVEYADSNRLGTRERLELFAKVCDAVHHGHQRGVIHRDLKPSNILVDASGQPKVIDFGVARATDVDIAATTALTDVGTLVGTLPYMSPEQCDGDPIEIDTRSDVYSLGVVLYELLCGRLPYDIGGGAITHALRVIKEAAPTRPSSVHRLLRGDLETILLKPLEKDCDHRYSSAEAFADDIRRYLRDEPIAARPPSAVYQLRKLVKRHRAVAALLVALLAVLVSSAVVSWVQTARTARERDTARSVAKLLTDMLDGADPVIMGHEVTGKDLVDRAVQMAETDLGGQPEVEETVREIVARAYQNLGRFVEAEREWRKADALCSKLFGAKDERVAFVKRCLGFCLHLAQRPQEAEAVLREAHDLEKALGIEESPQGQVTRMKLGAVLRKLGKLEEAERILLDVLASQAKSGASMEDRAELTFLLGLHYHEKQDLAKAREHFLQAIQSARAMWPAGDVRLVPPLNSLASVLMNLGDREGAEKLWTEAAGILEKRYPPEHPDLLTLQFNLGLIQEFKAEFVKSEALFRKIVEARRKQFGSDKVVVATALGRLANALDAQGKPDEALAALGEALEIHRKASGDDNLQTAAARGHLAYVLLRHGRLDEAEKEIEEVLRVQRKSLAEDHAAFGGTLTLLARLRLKQGRPAEAEDPLRKALEIREKAVGVDHWQTVLARAALGECLGSLGRHTEAEPLLVGAHEALQKSFAPAHPHILDILEALASFYDRWGRGEKAEEYRKALAAARR